MDKIDLIYDQVKAVASTTSKMDERLGSIEKNTDKNTHDLKEHMRRTEIGEKRLEHIEKKMTLSYLFKVVSSFVVTSGAVATAVYKLLSLFGK